MSDQRPTEDDFELIAERCQGIIACSVSGNRRDPIDAIDALSDVVFDLARLTFQARTSGGTAGSDPALMAACERAEELLSTDAARGEGG